MPSSFSWQTDAPEERGLDSRKLEAMWRELGARQTKTLLIARRDHIVFECYAADWEAQKKHYTASLAKALVGGLSLVLAIDDGLISPNDLAHEYIPQWKDDPQKKKIAIRHLATHSSGIENAELSEQDRNEARAQGRAVGADHMELPGWKGGFWRHEPDPFTLARDEAPVLFEPGSAHDYSNPGFAMLSWAVTASVQGSAHRDIRTLLEARIMEPLGIAPDEWSIGYGKTFEVDGLPLVANWGGGGFTARAVARIGLLLLQRGEWDGRQLIGPAALSLVLADAGAPGPERLDGEPSPRAGLGWWINSDGVWSGVPVDAFAGAGAGNQHLLVVPGLDLVVVRNGGALQGDWQRGFWAGAEKYLFDAVVSALLLQPPYPPSPVIVDVTWAPIPQIARLATGGKTRDGSDNWPTTWAADDQLYTAYGDGYGFEPGTGEKLSLGLAVVMGGPKDFEGVNIRYDGEIKGHGPTGEKASGMLAFDGVLYMWVRNADRQGRHSRLGFSTDRGRSWAWCDWVFEQFGHPAFINYGCNYSGARDGYVYIVSHDRPSAYETADHFVLMRVPKDALRQRESYEFFRRLDREGNPLWSADVDERGPVFSHAGQCRRSSVGYNAPLGRYLWWQQLTAGDTDTRFEGGFGLYDAPEPWGPWTTVYFTEKWDVGPGDLACFPAKWIGEDGKTLYLVFAGDDHFAVRRAVFETAGS